MLGKVLAKDVLNIYIKCTGERPCRSAISIKLLCNFIVIALQYGCYRVTLQYIFRTPFPWNTSGRLLQDSVFGNPKKKHKWQCFIPK